VLRIASVDAGAKSVPQLTFNLSARFVNGNSRVSTGFLGFLPILCRNWLIFPEMRAIYGP
jgi:hypothetical protein